MKRNFSIGFAFLLGVLLFSACGDDSPTYYGEVFISEPTKESNYTTSYDSVTLAGGVDFTDNGTLTQLSVTWSNTATGGSGDAQISVFCFIACWIDWQTSAIPLAIGDNIITVSASGNGGHSFTPATITVTRLPILSISGRVADPNGTGLAGIPLSVDTQFAHTNSSGDFSFTVIGNGTYAITPAWPSESCFNFSPSSLTVTLAGSDVSGQNFTASPQSPCYKISGRITQGGYSVSYGVETTVSLSAGSYYLKTKTNTDGYYSFFYIPNGIYTIRPISYYPHSFSPSSITATVSGANLQGQNFLYY